MSDKRLLWIAVICMMAGVVAAAPAAKKPAAKTADVPAASAMPVDAAWAQLKTYQVGQSRVALNVLEAHIGIASADETARREIAGRLAALLADAGTTDDARLFIAQQLKRVASDAQVPLLAQMLAESKSSHWACIVLETLPGEAAGSALLVALDKLSGDALVGPIEALGYRRDAAAVGKLAEVAQSAQQAREPRRAAMRALGRIGTGEAAASLMKIDAAEMNASRWLAQSWVEGLLQCADQLRQAGNGPAAAGICEKLWKSPLPRHERLGALRGLIDSEPGRALPLVIEAMHSGDAQISGVAVDLIGRIPGADATRALAAELPKLDAAAQCVLLASLGSRGDVAARDEVIKLIGSADDNVRAAAVAACETLAIAEDVPALVKLAAGDHGPAADAARKSLRRLRAAGVDEAIVTACRQGDDAGRCEAVNAAADRRIAAALPVMLEMAREKNARVQTAALASLSRAGTAQEYPAMIEILLAAADELTPGAENAAVTVGRRLPGDQRVKPVAMALAAAPDAKKASFLRVIARLGEKEGLDVVRGYLSNPNEALQDAAARALTELTDESAAPMLLQLAQETGKPVHRALALRAYLKIAVEARSGQGGLIARVAAVIKGDAEKKLLLGALGQIDTPDSLKMATAMLDDAAVRNEAVVAVIRLGKALARTSPVEVQAAMDKVQAVVKDPAVLAQAKALRSQSKLGSEVVEKSTYDQSDIESRKKQIQAALPKGDQLLAYLDCGVQTESEGAAGVSIKPLNGKAWAFPGAQRAAPGPCGTVIFTRGALNVELNGLSAGKRYAVGLTWWDYDGHGRVQALTASGGKPQRTVTLIAATALPSYQDKKQKPAEFRISLDPKLYVDGKVKLSVTSEAGPNTVVGEVWVSEMGAKP